MIETSSPVIINKHLTKLTNQSLTPLRRLSALNKSAIPDTVVSVNVFF